MLQQKDMTKGIGAYVLLVYALTALLWGSMIIFDIPGASAASAVAPASTLGLLLLFLGGFAPSIAGILMTWRVAGRHGLRDLWTRTTQTRFAWKWYLTILAIPLLALMIRVAVQLARGGIVVDSPLLIRPLNLVGFTITAALLGGALGEEFGWRGFAIDRLLVGRGPTTASVILGIFWALWHLPLFFISGTVQASHDNFIAEFGIFALWILALAVLFTWVYLGTGRSLFAALVFHAAVDWFGSLTATMIINGGIIDRLANSLLFALLAIVVVLARRSQAR